MDCEVSVCLARNIHGFKQKQLNEFAAEWEETPEEFNKLDLRNFLQDREIEEVNMEDAEEQSTSTPTKDKEEKVRHKEELKRRKGYKLNSVL